MPEVLLLVELAIELAFSILAIRAIVSWVRQPDRRHGHLALALASLAILILLAPALGGTGPVPQALTDLGIALFLISGYGLLMFRDSFVPFPTWPRRLLTGALVVVGVAGVALQLPSNPDSPHTPLQTLELVAIVGLWAFCMLEPILTFWLAARRRPAVEMARLRAISIGYAGLVTVVVFGTVAGSLNGAVSLAVDAVALLIVPVLYFAFFPPVWLRRMWRQPEEEQFRSAVHDLLLYSPDRVTLAEKALGWAERLVGGDAAFIVDAEGLVLASRGVTTAEATQIAMKGKFLKPTQDGRAPRREGATIIVPLDLQQGRGAIVIRSDRLMPIFGDEELSRLSAALQTSHPDHKKFVKIATEDGEKL